MPYVLGVTPVAARSSVIDPLAVIGLPVDVIRPVEPSTETLVTDPLLGDPLLIEVILPYVSTVILELVYEPAVTPVGTKDIFITPAVVIGDPTADIPFEALIPTEVTVPPVVTVCQTAFVPSVPKNFPLFPDCDGKILFAAAGLVVAPVPPLDNDKTPPKVRVPAVVIGPPLNVSPVVPPDASTDVTDPVPVKPEFTKAFLTESYTKDCPACIFLMENTGTY